MFLQAAPDPAPLAINHPLAERRQIARDWFVRTLEYAAACRCEHVTLLPGIMHEQEPADSSWKRAVEELGWRVEQAADQGIVLGVEAHVGSLTPDPPSAERLIRAVAGLTLTLDYTHFTRAGVDDSVVEPLIPLASHFHARGARPGRLQCAVRDNTIDYHGIIQTMNRTGYRGYIGVEYVWTEWERCNECDNLSETILLKKLIEQAR